jgi:hypothetical protein
MAARTGYLGDNIEAYAAEDGSIHIVIPNPARRGDLSSTGKTIQVASSKGARRLPGSDVKFQLTAYVSNPDYVKDEA